MRSDVTHFDCVIENGIATVSLRRPERKNPLTFDSYAELRDCLIKILVMSSGTKKLLIPLPVKLK